MNGRTRSGRIEKPNVSKRCKDKKNTMDIDWEQRRRFKENEKQKNTYTQNTKEAFEISVTHNEERRRDKLNTQKTC